MFSSKPSRPGSAQGNPKFNRECRYGAKCNYNRCHYVHPTPVQYNQNSDFQDKPRPSYAEVVKQTISTPTSIKKKSTPTTTNAQVSAQRQAIPGWLKSNPKHLLTIQGKKTSLMMRRRRNSKKNMGMPNVRRSTRTHRPWHHLCPGQ